MATTVLKTETFSVKSGQRMYIEQYGDKPHFTPVWRYGFIYERDGSEVFDRPISDMLLARPNKQRLINKF